MDIIYKITTITNNNINVTRETFENYVEELNIKKVEYKIETFEHDLGTYKLTIKAYTMYIQGIKEAICSIFTYEEK